MRGFPRVLIERVSDIPTDDQKRPNEIVVLWYLNSVCDEHVEFHDPVILAGDASDEQIAEDFKTFFEGFETGTADFMRCLEILVRVYSLGPDAEIEGL